MTEVGESLTEFYAAAGDWEGKRVLIAGGLGFIGSNLAQNLVKKGAQVTLVDCLQPEYGGNEFNIASVRGQVVVHLADLRDREIVNDVVREQDFLFNLAGQTAHLDSMRKPQTDLEMNCRAQLSLLEACGKQSGNQDCFCQHPADLWRSPVRARGRETPAGTRGCKWREQIGGRELSPRV